jgi:peptidoglycan/xylan/chitin deacetylase (PgdA/CDA1 family)
MTSAVSTMFQWWHYLRGNRARVLLYHSIGDYPDDPYAIPSSQFGEQLGFLVENGFSIVSLEEMVDRMRSGRSLRKAVVITFDDGYLDFLENAVPVLQANQAPATVFVVLGRVGEDAYWNRRDPGRTTMNWREIRWVRDLGFSIGSHTMTHPPLLEVDNKTLTYEVEQSLNCLRETVGETFLPFAYPWGRFSARVRDAVEKGGYDCAVIATGTWGNGYGTDPFVLKRDEMRRAYGLKHLRDILDGWYDLHYLRMGWKSVFRRIRTGRSYP